METKKKSAPAIDPRELRRKLDMNQTTFWRRVGVTQSAGSRYESGRTIPRPVRTLLDLAYGKNPLPQIAKLRGVAEEELVRDWK